MPQSAASRSSRTWPGRLSGSLPHPGPCLMLRLSPIRYTRFSRVPGRSQHQPSPKRSPYPNRRYTALRWGANLPAYLVLNRSPPVLAMVSVSLTPLVTCQHQVEQHNPNDKHQDNHSRTVL
ncbi:MAG: hypothetical protein HPY66_1719 [Firmicutes bacterium]|nr:hypothetical protein [Bacillota bacterium]